MRDKYYKKKRNKFIFRLYSYNFRFENCFKFQMTMKKTIDSSAAGQQKVLRY